MLFFNIFSCQRVYKLTNIHTHMYIMTVFELEISSVNTLLGKGKLPRKKLVDGTTGAASMSDFSERLREYGAHIFYAFLVVNTTTLTGIHIYIPHCL